VFENKTPRGIFEHKGKKAGGCKKLHSEELHNLYSLPNIIWMIKSGRMRWVEYVACIGEMRCAEIVFVRKPEGKRPLIGENIILEWILEK
jgi:hypothetical protein